jgi:hypothetical protein
VPDYQEDPYSDAPQMSRQNSGSGGSNTLDDDSLNVAFMEFLEAGDSNMMKARWLKYGFKDISPIWGGKPQVPSFKSDPKVIAQWPDFQSAMTEVEADWYYLSGHHGRQFASDGEDLDMREHAHTQKEIGFFNEPYHTGPWDKASASDPDKGRSGKDVYMTTSSDDWVYTLGPEDNPLYNSPHEGCKGVLLIGCNSLRYTATRVALTKYFPSAVIIGLMSRESNGISRVMKVADKYGRSFFKDPTSVDPYELNRTLNPFQGQFDGMAVMHAGTLYLWKSGKEWSVPHDEMV